MKKITTAIVCTVLTVLSCFAFVGCSSGKYEGKQFLLEDVSATYDDTVSQTDRALQDGLMDFIKKELKDSEIKPFCRFYGKCNTVVTNAVASFDSAYSFTYKLANYRVEKGKIILSQTITTKWDDDAFKIRYFRPSSLDLKKPTAADNSCLLDENNIEFTMEKGKLIMIEKKGGITVKYVFSEEEKINESTEYSTESYMLVSVTYREIIKDNGDIYSDGINIANKVYNDNFYNILHFVSDSEFKLGDKSYSFSFVNNKNGAAFAPLNGGSISTHGSMQVYGDYVEINFQDCNYSDDPGYYYKLCYIAV